MLCSMVQFCAASIQCNVVKLNMVLHSAAQHSAVLDTDEMDRRLHPIKAIVLYCVVL
jgi:hypothetical protein